MRKRAAVMIVEDEKLALIKRVRNGDTYFVLPGGGVEEHETPRTAARREALEELGVHAAIGPCLYERTGAVHEYYFAAEITGGEWGAGTGREFTDKERGRGTYEAVWLSFCQLDTVAIYPEVNLIKDLLGI